jgi:hypothetical protein
MLSPKEGLISDRRQVLHFQPHCYEHWSQTLGVTVEELLVWFQRSLGRDGMADHRQFPLLG